MRDGAMGLPQFPFSLPKNLSAHIAAAICFFTHAHKLRKKEREKEKEGGKEERREKKKTS